MSIPLVYPLINGVRYDYSCITNLSNGLPIIGITEINFSQELAPGEVYGTLPQKIGETRGQLKVEASFTILQFEFDNLIEQLCILNGTPGSGYMEARFDWGVQYQASMNGFPGPLIQDVLRGCKIKKHDHAYKTGGDPLSEKVDLSLFYILKNGRAPIGIGSVPPAFIPG